MVEVRTGGRGGRRRARVDERRRRRVARRRHETAFDASRHRDPLEDEKALVKSFRTKEQPSRDPALVAGAQTGARGDGVDDAKFREMRTRNRGLRH